MSAGSVPQRTSSAEAWTGDPLALESQVCFAITRASRGIVAAYRPVLEPLHLTHPQYLVMLALWEESPLTLKALSARLALDPGTLSPLVRRLESTGYVHRSRDAADERALAIGLTPEGRALRDRAQRIPAVMRERLGMDEDEVAALHASMMKVVALAEGIEADSDAAEGAEHAAGDPVNPVSSPR